jgi:hypothetical protein
MFLGNLCFLADHRGDYVEARRLGTEAIRLAWSLGRRMTAASGIVQLAGSELGLGHADRAARLLGASDEALRVLGVALHHGDRSEHERLVADLRGALGADEFDRLTAEGAQLALDEAVELALSTSEHDLSRR